MLLYLLLLILLFTGEFSLSQFLFYLVAYVILKTNCYK